MQLTTYLEKKGLTPTDFAKQIGVHRSSVVRFCAGTRRPNLATAARIEKATGGKVTTDDLLEAVIERSAAE